MCTAAPKPPPPPAAPPPPPPPPKPLEIVPTDQNANGVAKGRSALRIDKTINSDGTVGSGLNIPA